MAHSHLQLVRRTVLADDGTTLPRFLVQGCLTFLCLAAWLRPCQAGDGWTAVPEPKAVTVVSSTQPDKPQTHRGSDGWTVVPEPKSVVMAASAQAGKPKLAPPPAAPKAAVPPPPVALPLGDAAPKEGPRPVLESVAEEVVSSISEAALPMTLDPQRTKILVMKRPVTRISISDPKVLEVVQYSPTEMELIGLTAGQTSLTFWISQPGQPAGQGQVLRYLVKVQPNLGAENRRQMEYEDLSRKINELFPNSKVYLIPIADKLIVKGQARDAEEATQIMSIIRGQAQGPVGVRGAIAQGTAAEPLPGQPSRLPSSNVIDMLRVPGEMQVMLKVRVAELSRTALRKMGADFHWKQGDFTFDSLLGLGTATAMKAVLETADVKLVLDALSENSYGKVLAEPNLVTLNGHPAYFIAGGEFAVPVVVGVEGAAAATTNFRGFGAQLTFVPTILDKDRIRLQVAPSFSQLNADNTVEGIPGLDTRAVSTTVEMREGQWLAIAGLLQDDQTGSKTRVPFIGDIPVVGTVFSKRSVRREETELLILVSPELVHPLEPEQAPRVLPGMEVTEPSDISFFLTGTYEGDPDRHFRSTTHPLNWQQAGAARRDMRRGAAYQQTESYYIQGAQGFSSPGGN